MKRRRVYIAGPISRGDLAHNLNQASRAFVELWRAGFAPLCPHWSAFSGPVLVAPTSGQVYCVAGAQPNELRHADWLAVDLAWVEVSEAVYRIPGESTGADQETAHARALGIPVFSDLAALCEYFDVWQLNAVPNIGPAS